MNKMIFGLIGVLLFSSSVFAQSTSAELIKSYNKVAGVYHGTLTSEDGQTFAINLRLWIAPSVPSKPSAGALESVPTLAGSLEIFVGVNAAFTESFGSGGYSADTRTIILAPGLPNSGMANLDQVHLEKRGDNLVGTYCPSAKCNKVSVSRVKPEAK